MTLNRWPIDEEKRSRLRYGGTNPDEFLLDLLKDVEPFVLPKTDGTVLAPEILDPFIFLQFVAGLQGKYTINGSPFFGNWRLVVCVRRMAERLFALELAEALSRAEEQIALYDAEVLDAFDASDIDWIDRHQEGLQQRLTYLLIDQFQPLIDAGECHYGTMGIGFNGGDRLLAALAEWVAEEFPYEILADAKAVHHRLEKYRKEALSDESYLRAYTNEHLPEPAFDALKKLGYQFSRNDEYSRDAGKVPVPVQRFIVNSETSLYLLTFLDAQVIVEPISMKVLTKWAYEWPKSSHARLNNVPSFADRPSIVIDPISLNSVISQSLIY